MKLEQKPMLIIISGPSGVGKTTLYKRLLEEDPSLAFSVSVTTRDKRPGEQDGVDYFFISDEEYERLVEEDAFLEHEGVFGRKYGTLLSQVEEKFAQGKHVLLDIDTKGAHSVMKKVPDCVSVFILPPTLDTLYQRLIGRQTGTPEQNRQRFDCAKAEIAVCRDFTYNVINDDIEIAYQTLKAIIDAEKQRTDRYLVSYRDEE